MKDTVIDALKPRLTHRERFRRLMHFQTVDRGIHWEFGYLAETIQRWHREGLPPEYVRGEGKFSVEEYFGVDPQVYVPVNQDLQPPFTGDTEILEEHDDRRIERHPDGTVVEVQSRGRTTIPHYLRMAITGRDDWKRFKERLNPDDPARYPWDYRRMNEEFRHTNVPIGISLGSFLGIPRNWIGFEQIALLMYDDPGLIEDIVETLTQVYERTLERALAEIEADYAGGWEDICFRNGPLVSPAMFRSVIAPRVKRVCDLLRVHGVDVIWTDCDGNINDLVPIWLDCGLNCMFPVEVHAGTDPVRLRKEYGRRVLLRGGIAKYQLAFGKKEILSELKRVEHLVAEGGFIPHCDHRVPDDVPYENYRYYVREKLAMLGWDPGEIRDIVPLKGLV